MPTPPQLANLVRPLPPKLVMTNRIIWAAMIMGQVMFAVVSVVVRTQHPAGDASPAKLLGGVAGALFLVTAPISLIIPKLLIKRDASDAALASQYTAATCMSMALLEGPSLFALVVAFITGVSWPAAISILAVMLQLTRFPRATA